MEGLDEIEIIQIQMMIQKYTSIKMANAVGISRNTMSNILNRKHDPRHSIMEKIRNELGIKLEKL